MEKEITQGKFKASLGHGVRSLPKTKQNIMCVYVYVWICICVYVYIDIDLSALEASADISAIYQLISFFLD